MHNIYFFYFHNGVISFPFEGKQQGIKRFEGACDEFFKLLGEVEHAQIAMLDLNQTPFSCYHPSKCPPLSLCHFTHRLALRHARKYVYAIKALSPIPLTSASLKTIITLQAFHPLTHSSTFSNFDGIFVKCGFEFLLRFC